MKNVQKVIKTLLLFKEIIVGAAAIVLWFLAIWLSYQLNPITQNITRIENHVSANEMRIGAFEINHKEISENIVKIKEDVSYIRGVLGQ